MGEGGPEFSRPIDLDDLADQWREVRLVANHDERAALAARLRLDAVERLEATVLARRMPLDEYEVSGRLSATVVQTCVVTLQPVRSVLSDEFHTRYVPAGRLGEHDMLDANDEVVEALHGSSIDAGELVSQQLALAIDPFPRAQGAQWPQANDPEARAPGRSGPFAALAALNKGRDRNA